MIPVPQLQTAKKMTPYNTGKVKIGLAYSVPIRYETSYEEDWLQAAILQTKRSIWQRILGML
jgi:hypothetical protein